MSTLSTKIGSLPARAGAGGRDREFVHHINEETRTKHKKENAKDNQLALLDFKPQEPIDYELFVTKNRTILSNDPHRELVLVPIDDIIGVEVERPRLQLDEPLASSVQSPSPSTLTSSPPPPQGQLTHRCLRALATGWFEVAYRFAEYGAPCHVMLDSGLANGDAAGGLALEPLPYEIDLEGAAAADDESADDSDSGGGGPSADHLMKRLSLDTETSVSATRQRDQRPLLPLLPDLLPRRPWPVPLACDSGIRPLPVRHEAATRLLVTCVAFETELQAPDGGNPEPFFLSLCLVDLNSECTLSERFYWCPPGSVGQLSQEPFRVRDSAQPHPDRADARQGPPAGQANRSCVATLSRPAGPRVCLLVRVDKVVQGPPVACADRYAGRLDAKTGASVQKSARPFCNHLSHYRQPFGWAFHPLFGKAGQLNPCPRSLALYRHDPAKAADTDLMRCLREYEQRPERLASKFPQIPMRSFCITVQSMKDLPANRFNLYSSSLLPVARDQEAPAPPANAESALELEEFPVHDAEAALYAVPEPAFKHSLFVYPRQLNYDKCQGMFGRARNLSVFVELRDCDDELASAVRAVRARFRPDGVAWASWANTTVSYHDETPAFSDEIKLCLPLAISPRHHLFFKILHVSCDAAGKADKAKDRGGNLAKESKVGYAWLRLRDARSQLLSSGEVCLPVSVNLPTGYLDKPPQSSDLQWVDGGRPVFRVALRLASSVQTSEPCMQKFFMASEVALGCRPQQRDEDDVAGRLAALAQTPRHIAIRFLNPLLGQLIRLIANSQCQDRLRVVAMTTGIHLVAACCDPNDLPERIQAADASANGLMSSHAPAAASSAGTAAAGSATAASTGGGGGGGNLHERIAERTRRLFQAYVKFACLHDLLDGQTLHEELVTIAYETLKPGAADSLTLTRFLSSAWFFLGLLAKAMGESLVRTGRFKMNRSERFSDVFRYKVQNLVFVLASHIHSACRQDTRGLADSLEARPAGRANQALAVFLRRLLSMMDRGFAFQLVNQYCSTVRYGQLRIHFLDVLCQHEHYVPLNLPLVKHRLLKGGDAAKSDDKPRQSEMRSEFSLSASFGQQHFLVGCLLSHLQLALGQHYDLRKRAVRCLRQLLCKHAIDCRYQSAPMRSRVAALYLPFVSLLVDLKHRLVAPAPAPAAVAVVAAKIAAAGVQARRPPSDASFQASMLDGPGGSASGFRPASSASLMRQSAAAASGGGGDIGGAGGGSGALSRKGSMISGQASQQGGASVDPDILNKIAGFESTLPRPGYVAKRPKSTASGRASGSLRHNSATISEVSTSSAIAAAGTADAASDRLSHCSDITIIDEEGSDDDGSRSLASSVSKVAGRSCASEPFRDKERRDLLLCLLHVVSCLEDEVLVSWLSSLSPNDRIDFLEILEIALDTFRYDGKTKAKTFESISSSGALASKDKRLGIRGFRASKHLDEADAAAQRKAADARWVAEGHVSAQAGLAALHALCIFWQHFQRDLLSGSSEAPAFRRVINAYLQLLDLRQCEPLLRHAFASLRLFVARFASVLFAPGSPSACVRQLCACVLRCGESRQPNIRQLASGLLYLMARQNQAVSGCVGRLHSQAMVALAGQAERLSASAARLRRFEACLRLLRRLADGGGGGDLGRLCDSLLAVLRTTAAFALHRGNPEMCVELHWRLAESYSHTPSLRLTYLRNMAERHADSGHLSEAAFCVLHQAALTAEVLRVRGEHPNGYEAFADLSPNIEQFEQRFGDDLPQEERDGCSPEGLADLIQQAADLLARAERYELVAPCLRPALAFHEARRDYPRQAALYEQCAAACKAVSSTRGKRFLETFYRVGLYGDLFEEKQVFVYKEPGLTRLAELAERLRTVYEARFGADKVTMLTDSGEVDASKLEAGRAYVQITYVQAETNEADGSSRHFVLETPFTRSGERHGSVEDQWRRRTRLTAEAAFPTVVKRLRVVRSEHEDLSPLAVAVLELRAAAVKIRSAAETEPPDMKRLQMVLQGCLATQVHAGPMAYAHAFLAPNRRIAYTGDRRLQELEDEFAELLRACKLGLRVNKALVRSDQMEYHQCLVSGYDRLREQLLLRDGDDCLSLSSQLSQLDSHA